MSSSLATRGGPRTAREQHTAARPTRSHRDPAVDIARAGCLVVVVLLHALMVGVAVGPDGPILRNAMEGWPGFAALSWVVQVMPLFFLLGGFSAHTQWERMRERGAGYGDYLTTRVRRLFVPAVAALGAVVGLLSILVLTGVPAALVSVAGFRMSQPLWFLGVYVLCTVAVPPMAALHRRAPVVGLLAPVGLAVAVDIVRGATGITGIGFANLLFVWLAVQQLGFWLASGRLERVSRGALVTGLVVALGALALLCGVGVWSFDMLANLNPPTCALLLLAVVQLAAFRLLAPALRARGGGRLGGRLVGWVSARAMTVYLWHMPVLIVLAGALLVGSSSGIGGVLPEPLSVAWWLSRPLWLAVVALAVAAVVAIAARFETGVKPGAAAQTPSLPRALASAGTGAAGVLVVLVGGGQLAAWAAAVGLVCLALRILHRSNDSGVGTR